MSEQLICPYCGGRLGVPKDPEYHWIAWVCTKCGVLIMPRQGLFVDDIDFLKQIRRDTVDDLVRDNLEDKDD